MPRIPPPTVGFSARDETLDLVRGLSALVVLLGHARNFFMKDFGELADPGPMAKIFYFFSGLGHQAVMVFFVLSGFLVGGSVLSGLRSGRFSWSRYALARMTRLWVVLIPALVLTLGFDQLGAWLATPAPYAGSLREVFGQGPSFAEPAALGPTVFLGNLGFLQTVRLPVYGSNGPLWSLANEFWYYVLFPMLAVALRPHRAQAAGQAPSLLTRILLFAAAVGLLCILPRSMVKLGLIWLFGTGVWWVARHPRLQHFIGSRIWCGVGGAAFGCTLVASKLNVAGVSDFVVGLAFAAWMPGLLGPGLFPTWLKALVSALSDISYTLYVVHFPILFFLGSVVAKGRQFDCGSTGIAVVVGSCVISIVLARFFWLLFEGHTERVRKWASGFLPGSPASNARNEVDLPATRIA